MAYIRKSRIALWAALAFLPLRPFFPTAVLGDAMNFETAEEELGRLRKKQRQTRHDELFGGLSREEREVYDRNELRIRELHRHLSATGKFFRILIR
jgi:hypothetical protein